MSKDDISEAKSMESWEYEDEDKPLTERQKMLEFHGFEEGDDVSHLSNNEIRRMWWSYRNRKKLGL